MIDRLFHEHPREVGETYARHARVAAGFGLALARASAACFVHALVPALCRTTGSRAIRDLHTRMATHRRQPEPAQDAAMLWIAANI